MLLLLLLLLLRPHGYRGMWIASASEGRQEREQARSVAASTGRRLLLQPLLQKSKSVVVREGTHQRVQKGKDADDLLQCHITHADISDIVRENPRSDMVPPSSAMGTMGGALLMRASSALSLWGGPCSATSLWRAMGQQQQQQGTQQQQQPHYSMQQFRGAKGQVQFAAPPPPPEVSALADIFDSDARTHLTPAAIVKQLDRFIVVGGHVCMDTHGVCMRGCMRRGACACMLA